MSCKMQYAGEIKMCSMYIVYSTVISINMQKDGQVHTRAREWILLVRSISHNQDLISQNQDIISQKRQVSKPIKCDICKKYHKNDIMQNLKNVNGPQVVMRLIVHPLRESCTINSEIKS